MKLNLKSKVKFSKQEAWAGILQVLVFFCLLVVTTVLAFSFHDVYLYYFHSSTHDVFMKTTLLPTGELMNYDQIYKTSDWWSFMDNVINTHLVNLDPDEEQKKDMEKNLQIKFWIDNIIIGVPKLRQIRVVEHSCTIHNTFNLYFNDCYAGYDQSIEEKTKIFKSTPYLTYEEYPVRPLTGAISEYVGPGYVQFLTYNVTKNTEILKKLKDLNWIDRGTRVIILELVFYNINMETFSNVRLIAEKLPTGNILSTNKIQILPVYCIWSERRSTIIVVSTIFHMAIVFSSSREIWTLIKLGAYSYVRNVWKWLNLAFLTSAYTTIVLSMMHVLRMHHLVNSIERLNDELFLDEQCFLYDCLKMSLAICTVLIWLKLFRFVSFNKTMLNFSIALRRGYYDIVGFCFMFLIVFTAFATMGLLLFCKVNPAFSTYTESLVTMMRMLMTDFQYEYLERSDRLFGPLFFMLFILFIYFVLLNTFLAVISDAYVNVRHEDYTRYSILKAYLMYVVDQFRDLLKKLKGKKDTPKKVDFEQPRLMKKDEALNEYFGEQKPDAESDFGPENEAEHKQKSILQTRKELDRLTARVKQIEADTEHFIGKMDRILQKLELIANENQENQ